MVHDIVEMTKAKFNQNSFKHYLKEKYKPKLTVAFEDGLWLASPELIGFLYAQTTEQVCVIDLFDNLVKVDRRKLLEKLITVYNTTMDEWYEESSK